MSVDFATAHEERKRAYGRVIISGDFIDEYARRARVHHDRRLAQALALRHRLGMNERQIARVMRRLPDSTGAFVAAWREENASLIADLKREAERIASYRTSSWWHRLLARLRGFYGRWDMLGR